jgi:hypothetical protein
MMKLQSTFTSIIQETDDEAQKQSLFLPLSFLPASPPRAHARTHARTVPACCAVSFFVPATIKQERREAQSHSLSSASSDLKSGDIEPTLKCKRDCSLYVSN